MPTAAVISIITTCHRRVFLSYYYYRVVSHDVLFAIRFSSDTQNTCNACPIRVTDERTYNMISQYYVVYDSTPRASQTKNSTIFLLAPSRRSGQIRCFTDIRRRLRGHDRRSITISYYTYGGGGWSSAEGARAVGTDCSSRA